MGGGHRLEGTPAEQGATPSLAGSVIDRQLGRGEAFQGRQELPLGSMEKHLMGLGSGSSCSPTQEEVNGVGRGAVCPGPSRGDYCIQFSLSANQTLNFRD